MKKIITTTTDSLEGWEIKEYFPPVTANVVVGTNFLSDLSASFTDFFGGRSNSYEKKLQQLYTQAISIIEGKAKASSANAIVGLKIDVDEISGKNSQMFMITAYGTPVNATRIKPEVPQRESQNEKMIDGAYISQKVIAKRIIDSVSESKRVGANEAAFIAENPFPEFCNTALRILKMRSEAGAGGENDLVKTIREKLGIYFSSIDPSLSFPVLYGALLNAETSNHVRVAVQRILTNYLLIDYSEIIKLLESTQDAVKRIGLSLIFLDKPYYEHSDIEKLKIIEQIIPKSFTPLSPIVRKKGFLSGEKEVWECSCGQTNVVADGAYCQKCGNDIYGFKEKDMKPDDAVKLVRDRLTFLEFV